MGPCSETISRPKPGDTTGTKLVPRSEPKFLATELQGSPKGSSRSMDGHAPNTIRICNNRNVDKSRTRKTNESRGHMETVTTENEVYKSDKTEKESKGNGEVLRKHCQMNVQGLITIKQPHEKVDLLREIMHEEKPLFLALTETWLYDHREAELQIEDYNLFRKDRPLRRDTGRGRHVGGVALYIKSSWLPDSNEILGYSNTVVDVLTIHSKSENIIITVLYR